VGWSQSFVWQSFRHVNDQSFNDSLVIFVLKYDRSWKEKKKKKKKKYTVPKKSNAIRLDS